ncbi:RNA polymerase factor sigma-54 [Sporosarcina sp. JAI121]|uniref:RNA polymerase factor sigma-54 n=1 Tax=Sporosarcina sp. JAI121 TaxID=2723064 RepID=UPI0015CB81BB|nr:RNA polymerase factor sigma-54 [Sporosarcina sp. JAI121]NYF25654.1 RNA polymerase sigma-54 factor [Sporosarcina sp. JAI121]
MELGLQQRQELNLLMTFELRQAIELLQYSTYELEQYIRDQELENPLIKLKEKEEKPVHEERLHRQSSSFGSSEMPMDVVRSNDINMRDELLEQAKFMYPDDHTQKLIKYLLYNLDDNGYLQISDNHSNGYLAFADDDIEKGIHLLQQLGPIGIGARDLKECLLLQITYNYPEKKLAACLVEHHLNLIADRKWKEIASKMNINMNEVKDLFDFIQTLNPRPCSLISDCSTEYLTPDIIVEWKDDEFTFHLNDGYLPAIQMNKDYSQYLNAKNDASKYINTQYKNYQWLLSSIEQRRNTIIKIVHVLLEKQADFFKNGFRSLKPLTLKEVADEIDMHESTVSRATTNKVIQTPFGTFDLRLLFTSKLDTSDGNSISQTKVKKLLENFIAQENKFKPYSDQKIAEYFNTEKGITISRRTISKYREELRIPPSSKRKDIQV